jgi:hypothetical protein
MSAVGNYWFFLYGRLLFRILCSVHQIISQVPQQGSGSRIICAYEQQGLLRLHGYLHNSALLQGMYISPDGLQADYLYQAVRFGLSGTAAKRERKVFPVYV